MDSPSSAGAAGAGRAKEHQGRAARLARERRHRPASGHGRGTRHWCAQNCRFPHFCLSCPLRDCIDAMGPCGRNEASSDRNTHARPPACAHRHKPPSSSRLKVKSHSCPFVVFLGQMGDAAVTFTHMKANKLQTSQRCHVFCKMVT